MLHENYWQHGNVLQRTCTVLPSSHSHRHAVRNNKENRRDLLPNKAFKTPVLLKQKKKKCLQMSSILATDARIPSPLSRSSG